MKHIFVAFTGEKTRHCMANVFSSTDITVGGEYGTGMELLQQCGKVGSGVVLSGDALYDMTAEELSESLPKGFSLMVLADEGKLDHIKGEGITRLKAPVRQSELLEAAQKLFAAMEEQKPRVSQRSDADRALIAKAKHLIMERNTLSEEQAYRFIQKKSMDMGAKMVQTARGILSGEICM